MPKKRVPEKDANNLLKQFFDGGNDVGAVQVEKNVLAREGLLKKKGANPPQISVTAAPLGIGDKPSQKINAKKKKTRNRSTEKLGEDA